MFHHFIDVSCSVSVASKKPGQRLANSRKHSMKHKFRDVCVLMFWAFQHSMTAICWSFKLYIHHTLVTFFFCLYHSSTVFTKKIV